MKQKIGFLVLKSGGNEEARYLYPTVLYHLALRSRIKRELETGKVLRCCCREDETEVTVNENLELQFLRGRQKPPVSFRSSMGVDFPYRLPLSAKKGPERKQAYTLEKRLTCASGSDLI